MTMPPTVLNTPITAPTRRGTWHPSSPRIHPVTAPPADRSPDSAPVIVTVQITLPAERGPDTEDPMLAATALAERLRAVASSAGAVDAATVDVSTTVAVVLDQTPSASPSPRRTFPRAVDPAVPPAPLRILTERRDAILAGATLTLTRREYDLLLFLATHPGRVFTRAQLLRSVWGQDIISGERTVDVHVRRLRTKLAGDGPTVTTIRGIGYRLDDAARVEVVAG